MTVNSNSVYVVYCRESEKKTLEIKLKQTQEEFEQLNKQCEQLSDESQKVSKLTQQLTDAEKKYQDKIKEVGALKNSVHEACLLYTSRCV